ncbi:MAG: Thermostable carboxypeptidase 1 [Spirochaetes bacterium ADurb.Bin110]|nr:MAG: Thermostable carboxypeptidase 1 [Spirochaetes bacterium ADurb.Bin110]
MQKETARLIELDREHTLMSHISAVLGWDQETYMPSKAIQERASQLALLEGLAHQKAVNPEIGELLATLEAKHDLSPDEKAYIRKVRRDYDIETKLPEAFVTEYAKSTSIAQAKWAEAKKDNDFKAFEPHLEKIVALSQELAGYLNPNARPYDVLLDLYEPGSTQESIAAVFSTMKAYLVDILDKIRARPQIEDRCVGRYVSCETQERISLYFMKVLHYEMDRGRLDVSAHPFTTSLGADDIRITTRYVEDYFPSSLFSTIHESGHALYDMGIDPNPEFRGTKLAGAVSMAVHESQSRLWENIVGRSRAFWERNFLALSALLGDAGKDLDFESFIKSVNRVSPSLIRTEADEVTYGLHIIARFELESALLEGNLGVADMPGAWGEKYKKLLGLEVPNDRVGCLQDVHWSIGYFGYFPSYALGNLYAAQFWAKLKEEVSDIEACIAGGDILSVLTWLRTNVHCHGSRYMPGELVEKVTGSALDPVCFEKYLREKYSSIYGF